ncbi:stage V sporulation protein AE [Laceyella putida]|uniref:Stage V sporulation protein AE n=1 Tax=Laceyella putida TaxID=110101 RepID=A0ABW2RJ55_9BACL
MSKRQVILVTDGDNVAKRALEVAAKRMGGRCISRSGGNPTSLTGSELVELIKQTPYDPVLVMFDDCGSGREGQGEMALREVATHPDIEVLGAIAVASNCHRSKGTPVHLALDRYGNLVGHAVDKHGNVKRDQPLRIFGDTVEVLNEIPIPFIVGIGDVGKMREFDDVERGAPVTCKAIQLILSQYNKRRS